MADSHADSDTPHASSEPRDDAPSEQLVRQAGLFYEDHAGFLLARLAGLGVRREQAEEILHDFVIKVAIERGLAARCATLSRTGQRKLLAKAITDHLSDVTRRDTARTHRDRDYARDHAAELRPTRQPSIPLVDRELAVEVMREALRLTERGLRESGLDRHWEAFERRVLAPAVRRAARPDPKTLASELDFDSPQQLAGALTYAKHRLAQATLTRLRHRLPGGDYFADTSLLAALDAVLGRK